MSDSDNVIKKYTFQPIPVDSNFDGFGYFPETNEVKPVGSFQMVSSVLDVMTASAEAGVLRSDSWVRQIFATEQVFQTFTERLASYDECSRIHDRWHSALMRITDTVNEEGFVLSEEIASRMLEQAEETGQI